MKFYIRFIKLSFYEFYDVIDKRYKMNYRPIIEMICDVLFKVFNVVFVNI